LYHGGQINTLTNALTH